jgi:flagellin-like protein
MDLKKIFRNDKAVSPVIGVVLMVAITVILAAAIGSSVFGKGPAESAPQANINAKFTNNSHTLVIEHLGGDNVVWENSQIRFTYENGTIADSITKPSGQFSVGDITSFNVNNVTNGNIYNLKITDNNTQQLICDKEMRG